MLEINNTTKQKLNLKKIKQITKLFLQIYKKVSWDVSIAVVSDEAIKKLNKEYRGIDKPTDVLSFNGDKKAKYLGEIIINIKEAQRTRKYEDLWQELGWEKPKTEQVFYFLLVHGLLHLIGYDDATDKQRIKMLILGREFFTKKLSGSRQG